MRNTHYWYINLYNKGCSCKYVWIVWSNVWVTLKVSSEIKGERRDEGRYFFWHFASTLYGFTKTILMPQDIYQSTWKARNNRRKKSHSQMRAGKRPFYCTFRGTTHQGRLRGLFSVQQIMENQNSKNSISSCAFDCWWKNAWIISFKRR